MFYNDELQSPYQTQPLFYRSATSTTLGYPETPQAGEGQPPYPPFNNLQHVPAPQPKPKPRRSGGRAGALLALALLLALVFGVGAFAGWEFTGHRAATSIPTARQSIVASSSGSTAANPETAQEAAIAAVEPAVVELNVTTAQGQAIGSGVIIDKSGDIITNNHVVSGAQSITAVLSNGATEQAQLVGTSPTNDLAVVRIKPFVNMAVANIGDSSKLTVGQEVLAIGNPLGITQTATNGIVSALNRSAAESADTTLNGLVQTDAPINPGNSGGALINLQGQLVGIPTLGAIDSESHTPANGVGFAIPVNHVKTVVAQILQRAGQ